ncbi:prepilin peptidase [Schaalia vaccimaxillae]|uniref:prepilin peptidase n=1 Tax=Schaalia vaccimaxillae TaxID=183916 RepID=UPI003C7201F1
MISGLFTWLALTAWLWRKGWKIQRRYFVDATLAPMKRNAVVWAAVIIGAVTVVAAQERPAAPAVITVAMVGSLSAVVDARTHRLPNGYTQVMALGVIFGIACGLVTSSDPASLVWQTAAGSALWFVPAFILNRMPGGLGFGDVKLAPVLGAMVGAVGIDAAIGGFLLAFVAAGLAALWRLVVGTAGTGARMPMGPWLIGAALAAHLLWGIVPDWL